ncbi:MAG TPA: SAM-dependent methyltransferase [Gemmobacter sp.]|nr:MAG: SAM-dependent methyltransferase [Rhodobacteraceae bacterium GWF1_65_7]HBD91997.1 SAM-dependent methyltransferase [Gemmobacter sp.]
MTPAARLSAAIEIIDRYLAGTPAEQALTNWARASRFAGSGDRNAIRDLVFDAIRCRRSFAALGGGETGRGLILGGLRAAGVEPEALFTGEGHAPPPLSAQDAGQAAEGNAALDLPDWLLPGFTEALGADLPAVAARMRHRAPVFLRVNPARATPATAMAALAEEGIAAAPHPLAPLALEVTEHARRIHGSAAYLQGMVELQDAASQAVVAALPLTNGMKVLDYCAGGGGKALAMGAMARLDLFAHDADPRRMRDLPSRAARAGLKVAPLTTADLPRRAPFDLVLADAPCSGSGSWRRAPEGKWLLTPERLAALLQVQAAIFRQASALVRPGGCFAYATCSMLAAENGAQVDDFLAGSADWQQVSRRSFTPLDGGDGFFIAVLQRIR